MRRARQMILVAVLAVGAGGCHRHVATQDDCRAILNRLVEMELAESGFHDPALVPRWQAELARRFEGDLRRCRAIRVRNDLAGCLRAAQNPEQVAHRCVE
ncbi:MAG TPA: hypothetical protein VMT03_18230 [Polyangia bacterium]|nr:hypothetical protein [Polyangia bacterium]